ncbi:MAG: glycosyltransferase family 2 protein [Planctomycetota bacterium]|nr:glycosyltransferase family 2 protein [Planctomycetota bacterium]
MGVTANVVSIVIPCRNEADFIDGCLDSLLAQELSTGQELEILVADGMSDDGTRGILVQRGAVDPRIRMIDNPGRIVSSGLNAAIAASTGEIVVRIDVHSTYAGDYVANCLRVLASSGADNVGGPWVARGRDAVSNAIAAAFASPVAMGGARGHDASYEGPVDTVYLGCWRRELFDRIGGFDEALVRNQDDEFNLRIHRSGGRVFQSPAIQSWYTPRSSLRRMARQYFQYGYWKVGVMRRHRLPASPRHLVPALFVAGLSLGWLPALWYPVWWACIAIGLVAYAGIILVSMLVATRCHMWQALIASVAVVMMHLAYGIGTWRGCIDALFGRFGQADSVASLSR